MTESTELSPELIRDHAGYVDGIAERVNTALAASRQIRVGNHAYGLLCQALPAMMTPTHDDFDTALDELHTAFTETADLLRESSTDIETLDFGNGEAVR